MKTPKLVKPLAKDYKAAIAFLANRLGMDLEKTPKGNLKSESVGILKGYIIASLGFDFEPSVSNPDFLEYLIEFAGLNISATTLALWFRNERELIKNVVLRVGVVKSFVSQFPEYATNQTTQEKSNEELESSESSEEDEEISEEELIQLNDEGDWRQMNPSEVGFFAEMASNTLGFEVSPNQFTEMLEKSESLV